MEAKSYLVTRQLGCAALQLGKESKRNRRFDREYNGCMVANSRIRKLTLVLKWVVVFVILRALVGIVSNYPDYFPPNFDADFLFGRDRDFYGAYGVAFYAHLLSTPFAMVNGLVLIN